MPDEPSTGETPTEEPQSTDEMSLEQRFSELEARYKETEAELRKVNYESATRRKKLESYEQEEEKRKQAEMTELERVQKKLDDLENEYKVRTETYQDNIIRQEIRVQAARMGFANPDIAYLAADKSNIALNEDGNVEGVEDALKALAEAESYLLAGGEMSPRAPSLDAGAGNSPTRKGYPALTAEERKVAEKSGMSYEEYAKKKAERQGLYAFIPEPKEK